MPTYKELKEKGQTSEQYYYRVREQVRKHGAPELMTTNECAAMLRLNPKTLARWRKANVGPPATFIPGKRGYFYTKELVLKWLEERTLEPQQAKVMRKVHKYSGRARPSRFDSPRDVVAVVARREKEFKQDLENIKAGVNIEYKAKL